MRKHTPFTKILCQQKLNLHDNLHNLECGNMWIACVLTFRKCMELDPCLQTGENKTFIGCIKLG